MDSGLKYQRIIRAVQTMPWCIVPRVLVRIMDVLEFQAAGLKLSHEEIAAHVGMQAASRPGRTETAAGVEVIRLRGIVANHIEQVNNISGPGGTSVEGFRQRFDAALANDNVGSILIDTDSPGGAVDGVPELAAHILTSRGTKPIVAHTNTLMASAAYWIGTAADEVVMSPSASAGSIGVFTAHSDLSKALEARGETVTLIHAGKHKVDGNPFAPLGEEARAHIQAQVDEVYRDFVAGVADGRGVSTATVLKDFGEGRTYHAPEAVRRGMADGIETFGETLARLQRGEGQMRAGKRRRTHATAPSTPAAFEFL